jgi:hypothetical protein
MAAGYIQILNTMKTIIFSFILALTFLPLSLLAQQKKQVQKQNTTTAPVEKWTDQSERGVPCPYEQCDLVIQQTIALYQPLANQTGQAVWTCVACCLSGYIVYATVVINPLNVKDSVRVADF